MQRRRRGGHLLALPGARDEVGRAVHGGEAARPLGPVVADPEGAQGVGHGDDDGRPEVARAGDEWVGDGQARHRVTVVAGHRHVDPQELHEVAGVVGGRHGHSLPIGAAPGRTASARLRRSTPMLRLVLPKGSLERATMQLFEDADLAVNRASDVAYRATVADPRINEVRILRPQEIPVYVADGLFDLGITGRDCIEERGSEVVSLGELAYSKATANPARVVLAVGRDSPGNSLAELAARRRPSGRCG